MPCKAINNHSDRDFEKYKPLFNNFFPYTQKTLGYDKPFTLTLASDVENQEKPLGKTAHYDPQGHEITIYVDGRHIKDIMRSISHELVHHTQNCAGKLDRDFDTSLGYAQEDGFLRGLEKDAYERGNMTFRDWEDEYKQVYGEGINIGKNHLKKLIKETLKKYILNEGVVLKVKRKIK